MEFIRVNQQCYIRDICDEDIVNNYEFSMISNNALQSILAIHSRKYDGIQYLYYNVTNMQTLDVYMKIQKLRRSFFVHLAESLLMLNKELAEYTLDISKISFYSKYVLIDSEGQNIRFLYKLQQENTQEDSLEHMLEECIDSIDYEDESLVEIIFKLYDDILNKQEKFSIEYNMRKILDVLSEANHLNVCSEDIEEVIEEQEAGPEIIWKEEGISKTEGRRIAELKKGCLILISVDVVGAIIWRPWTILKFFLEALIIIGCIVLYLWLDRRERSNIKKKQLVKEHEMFMEQGDCSDLTQVMNIEEVSGVLYNIRGNEPNYIYITEIPQIIGKEQGKVQIVLSDAGVSRIHAMVVRTEEGYTIEDLASTNGTYINNNRLHPREGYVLKAGDRVRFSDLEYIFQ